MPNIEKLKALHERLVTTPEGWDQEFWAQQKDCGTSYCMAGWACVLDGQKIDWGLGNSDADSVDGYAESSYLTTGERVDEKGREILGLNYEQADDLFYCTNNASALMRLENLIDELDRSTTWRT